MRLNRPMTSSPTAVVTTRPATIVPMIAATSRTDRVASQSVSSMAPIMTKATTPIFSSSVANSWSASGTSPVRRTRTPWAASSPSPLAAASMASLAASPGLSAPWSSSGWARIRRRVGGASALLSLARSRCQEKVAGFPAREVSIAAASALIGLSSRSSLASPASTPSSTVSSEPAMPRRLGSTASGPSSGCASMRSPVACRTCATEP